MEQKVFLIFGVPNGGLFLARQLRKQWPDSIIYAIGLPTDIGRVSSVINKFFLILTLQELRHAAMSVKESITGNSTIYAFIGSNPMLEAIVQSYSDFFDIFHFENDYQTYAKIVNKKEMENYCISHAVLIPQNYNIDEIEQINYPIVVKPLVKVLTIGATKCKFIKSQEELLNYFSQLHTIGIEPKLMNIQQAISGNNQWEYGYGGFFYDGKPTIDIVFHQYRQYPQGLCCYIREMSDVDLANRIRDIVNPLLKGLKYNGFIEFDIKEDANTREIYILDINPRPWRSSDMLSVKLGDSTVFHPKDSGKNVVWRYPYGEFWAFVFNNSNNVSYKQCKLLSILENQKGYVALSDSDDSKPKRVMDKTDLYSIFKLITSSITKKGFLKAIQWCKEQCS